VQQVEQVRNEATGAIEKRVREVAAPKDTHGNAVGTGHDLAVDGAFEGQTVAVLHLYTGEGFDFALPREALKQKGFAVYRWMNQPPAPAELERRLKDACQLWIISSDQRLLTEAHLAVIKRFFDSGRGVYIWGDNQPYYADANAVAQALLGSQMTGNVPGDTTVGLLPLEASQAKRGLRRRHLLTTGLEYLYEGVTIATIAPAPHLEPLLYGSAGNLVAASYDHGGKRAILDGGFTRLFLKWDTAGTGRYVKNAAAWLANAERFGTKVVSAKVGVGTKH
jgi:hypothetical protein